MKLILQTKEHPEFNEKIKEFSKEDINKKISDGLTPLILATTNAKGRSSNKTVKILLELGADPNQKANGKTALIWSLLPESSSNTKTIKILLDHGADPNLKDKDEKIPLCLAAKYARNIGEEAVILLINAGADINPMTKYSPLLLAVKYSDNWSTEKTVKILLDAGAEVNVKNKDRNESTILHHAIFRFNLSTQNTLKLLLEHGADTNIQDRHGLTPLMLAIDFAYKTSSEEIFELLLQTNPNIFLKDNKNRTAYDHAIILAKKTKKFNIVRSLLDKINYKPNQITSFVSHYIVNKENYQKVVKSLPPKTRSFYENYRWLSLATSDLDTISYKKVPGPLIQAKNALIKQDLTLLEPDFKFILDLDQQKDPFSTLKEYINAHSN